MAGGRLLVIQVCIHFGCISVLHGQRPINTGTRESSTTVRYTSNIITEDDRDSNFLSTQLLGSPKVGSTPSRWTTTSTRRSIENIDYPDSTHRNPSRPVTTTRYPRPPELTTRNYWDTTRDITIVPTTQRPNNRFNHEYNQYITAPAPAVNYSVFDFKLNMLNVTWNATLRQGSVPLKTLRQFSLTFICNASYPVEWLCEKPSGASTWDVEEIRHFELVRRSSGFSFGLQDLQLEPIYTALLKLTYEKIDNIPEKLQLNCARARRSEKYRADWEMKYSQVNISRDTNDTLHVRIKSPTMVPRTRTNSGGNTTPLQYGEQLGRNVDCRVDLRWFESEYEDNRFECTSEQYSNANIDFKTDDNKCYDAATCERMYTKGKSACQGESPRGNTEVTQKIPSELWTEGSAPSAGVVFCIREDDKPSMNDNSGNRTDALHFVHSLPPICLEDSSDESRAFREKLYVGADVGIPKDMDTLENGFMSFCWTPRSYEKQYRDWKVYAGENVSVTCIGSIYHFAMGTRIGIVRTQQNLNDWPPRQREQWDYARIVESSTEFKKTDGYFNYTAKVHIKSADVSQLFCETYLKQRESFIRKYIPIRITIPKNITLIGNTQVALYNYTGQRNFELKCEAHGDPPPTITWKNQGREIPSLIEEKTASTVDGRVISVLRFPSLKDSIKNFSVAELQGTYTCDALNQLDRSTKAFLVSSNSSEGIPIAPTVAVEVVDGGSAWVLWVVLPIFAVGVIAVILFLVWKIKMQSRELRLLSKAEVDEFIFGKPEFLQHHSSSEEVNNYAPFLPYNQGYEIGKEQLEIDENAVLGSGAYAIVLRGTLQRKDGERVRVAIKTSRAMDDISFFKALLSELKIMGFIGTHPNIVNLVGAHTKNIQNREIFIAIEFCENGNLLTYLRDHRNRFKTLVGPDGDDFLPGSLENVSRDSFVSPANGLNTVTLIKWAYEIANGMEFLSQKNVIHGDLAARNILLNEYLIAKIGDFGLSRQLFEYANYIKKQQSPLPWKWLAIECLQDMRFSVKSDVWAYGIMLFEIFSLGQVPYPGHSYNDEFLEALINGKRPNRPNNATNQIYSFMTTCWRDKSEDRPNFTHIREFFNKLLCSLVPQEYLDLHEKVTSTPPNPTSNTLTVDVHQCCAETPKSSTLGSKKDEGKQSRFSFNTKTITAVFHRN